VRLLEKRLDMRHKENQVLPTESPAPQNKGLLADTLSASTPTHLACGCCIGNGCHEHWVICVTQAGNQMTQLQQQQEKQQQQQGSKSHNHCDLESAAAP
jgi:hypothetical protein